MRERQPMSATGLEVFDRTIQITNIWLKQIMDELGVERRGAMKALRAVLHALRDRLTLDEAAQLSAQLPLLVRGVYWEDWDPSKQPSRERHLGAFIERIAGELGDAGPIDPEN